MSTEEYQTGYADGYSKGWNDAVDEGCEKPNEADELIRNLGFDPERFRTDGGAINHAKLRAAILNPDEYAGLKEGGAT